MTSSKCSRLSVASTANKREEKMSSFPEHSSFYIQTIELTFCLVTKSLFHRSAVPSSGWKNDRMRLNACLTLTHQMELEEQMWFATLSTERH